MMKLFSSRVTVALIAIAVGVGASAAPPLAEVRNSSEISQHFDSSSRVRVLNVWATWCVPCVAEMPALEAIHTDYRARGVSLVAVSMDDALPGSRDEARERVTKFIASKSISFPSVLYVGLIPAIQSELRLTGEIPVTIVFDAKGNELERVEGILEVTKFRADLDRILASKEPSTR